MGAVPLGTQMPASRRFALASRIAGELRRGEGRNLVAVGLYGSVARREDRAHSDIDLIAVIREKRPLPRFEMREGVLVSLLVETPAEARSEVYGFPWNLPEALSGWRSMRPLDDPTGFLRRLRARARRPTPRQFRETAKLDLLSTFEDYGKLRNALEAGDAAEAREMAIWFTAGAVMVDLCLKRHVLRTGRHSFIEAKSSGDTGALIFRLRYESNSIREMSRLASTIWSDLVARGRREGIRFPDFP